MDKSVKLQNFSLSNSSPLVLIAGPCQIEGETQALESAQAIKEICQARGVNLIYKSSFDKANRTSISGERGIGLSKALPIFERIANELELAVLTDVHSPEQCELLSPYVDVLQIPAFLCRQTDLLLAAGRTDCVVNIKKGQFLDPFSMSEARSKVTSTGNERVLLTERGTTFGYNNLVVDMRSLSIMARDGDPVIFDATHSVQLPGGEGKQSGGQREFVSLLARSAVAAGVAGVFIECHPDPDRAPSDGPCMLPISKLDAVLAELMAIDSIVKPS